MYQILSCVTEEHSLLYVLAAVLVLATGLICSMIVFQRGILAETRLRARVWAGVSAAVTAIGIWATHFVAMLGFRPGFDVHFDGLPTLGSVVLAITGFFVTSQILISGMTALHRGISAMVAAVTVTAMHYYGANALKAAALLEYDLTYVVVSVVAVLAFFSVSYFSISTTSRLRNLGAFAASIAAVASLHFIGMTAMNVTPLRGFAVPGWAINPVTLGAWVVLGVTFILVAAFLAAGWDTVINRLRFKERRKLSLLVNAASEAILIVRADGAVVEVNDAATRLFCQSRSMLAGLRAEDLVGLDPFSAKGSNVTEHQINAGQSCIPVDLAVRDLEDEGNGLVVVSLYDLRDRIRNEAHIRKLAYSDQLTGLPNRAAFHRALDALWARSSRDSLRFSVVLVDLDEFKDVNDQYGHSAGDFVLIETARRLREGFGQDALVARLGGDEFAVLLARGDSHEDLMATADACVAILSDTILFEDISIRAGASIGIAVAHSHSGITDAPSLMKAADRALYAAKQAGRRTAKLYDQALHERSEQKRALESDLVRAVQNKEFVLYYQAKVCSLSRRVLGYEALIRWHRPGHGLVMPNDFIEIAEQSTVIQDIGRWCIYEACGAAAKWTDTVTISVNLSARQFLDPNLYATIRDALRKSGLDPARLELEITETSLIQNTVVAARILQKIKKLGVQIALDDFGTGYSSMRFVQQFPFDRIKIDRSFISSMEEDKKAFAIIDAILRLGSSLSIPVVAEGVETESQALRLMQARCSELQGFLLSRPAPLSEDGVVETAFAEAS